MLLDVPTKAETSRTSPTSTDTTMPGVVSADDRLRRPLFVGAGDETEYVCSSALTDHLGRARPAAWHLVLHRAGGETWTHLYRVLPDHGGHVMVLLARACAGDAREALRRIAVRAALGLA
ncbi:hypothetical protein [Lichenicola sp.]|uniref:hypothetical protein n=1 Tax=Lichenicola sp. TaxID=2804529 RepID=UPI003B0025B7